MITHPDSIFLGLFIVQNLFIYTQHNIYCKKQIGNTPPGPLWAFFCWFLLTNLLFFLKEVSYSSETLQVVFTHRTLTMSVRLSLCRSVDRSVCLCVCLSVCLSVGQWVGYHWVSKLVILLQNICTMHIIHKMHRIQCVFIWYNA